MAAIEWSSYKTIFHVRHTLQLSNHENNSRIKKHLTNVFLFIFWYPLFFFMALFNFFPWHAAQFRKIYLISNPKNLKYDHALFTFDYSWWEKFQIIINTKVAFMKFILISLCSWTYNDIIFMTNDMKLPYSFGRIERLEIQKYFAKLCPVLFLVCDFECVVWQNEAVE